MGFAQAATAVVKSIAIFVFAAKTQAIQETARAFRIFIRPKLAMRGK